MLDLRKKVPLPKDFRNSKKKKKKKKPPCVLGAVVIPKYKCLSSVRGNGRDSSFQEGVSHTYTLRLL